MMPSEKPEAVPSAEQFYAEWVRSDAHRKLHVGDSGLSYWGSFAEAYAAECVRSALAPLEKELERERNMSNCDKLTRERQTKRYWQERARSVLEALQCSLPKQRQYAEPWERHMRAVDIVRGLLLDCCTCPRTALDAQGEPNKSTCELTEEEHAVFVPGRTVVHYIRRWSGNREDETPLCGADSFHRTESGIMHDSAGNSMNICKECAEIALRSSIADESVEIARRELLKDFSARMSMEETATCAYRIAAAIRAGR